MSLKRGILNPQRFKKMDIEKNRRQRSEASARYNKANTKQIALLLNLKTDADILHKLEQVENKQGYIKSLIRQDILKND